MSGNSDSSTGSTASTLADVLAGGALGYLDSQGGQPVTVTEPVPGTPYGIAGVSQPTSGLAALTSGSNATLLLVGLVVVLAVVMLRR